MYPYQNTFEINLPKLEIKTVYPRNVLNVKFVQSPMSALNGGRFKMLADGKNASIIIDFGEETVGDILFSASGKGKLHFLYGETLEELSCDKEEVRCRWYRYCEDFFTVSSVHNFHSEGRRGFRYLQIDASEGTVQITNLICRSEGYPVESRGSFMCSDDKLNEIWKICERTTRLCMQNWYEDGIKRDGLLWIGDVRVQALCNYALYGDTALIKECIKMIANSQREDGMLPACAVRGGGVQHPGRIEYMFGEKEQQLEYMTNDQGSLQILTYCTDFLGIVYEYYMFSGDLKTVQEVYPFAVRQAHYLADTIDWEDYDGMLLASTHSEHEIDTLNEITSYLASLLSGLNNFLKLTQITGDKKEEKFAVDNIGKLEERLKKEYTDKDGILRQGDAEWVSSTAMAFAHMCGFATKDTMDKLLDMKDTRILRTIFGMCTYWVLRGFMLAEHIPEALEEIRRVWGCMVDSGATTCMEALDMKKPEERLTFYRGSWCHGWSAGPADLFTRYILGVEFLEAGGSTVKIKPNLADLDWAEGTVPTIYGDIHIRIDESGLSIKSPQGVTVIKD